jgi:hypothetical protein
MGVTKRRQRQQQRQQRGKQGKRRAETKGCCWNRKDIFELPRTRPLTFCTGKRLFRCGHGKGEDNLGQAILVFGVGVFDVGFGFLQLGLGKLNDGAETEMVARLGEREREIGLRTKVACYEEAFKGPAGI